VILSLRDGEFRRRIKQSEFYKIFRRGAYSKNKVFDLGFNEEMNCLNFDWGNF
jgi:hypothetical protein